MENAGTILGISSCVILMASATISSYKTGIVFYFGALGKGQPKYEIDKSNVGKFAEAILFAFLLSFLYCFIFTRELEVILFFSLFNVVAITHCLVCWILLKEKKR